MALNDLPAIVPDALRRALATKMRRVQRIIVEFEVEKNRYQRVSSHNTGELLGDYPEDEEGCYAWVAQTIQEHSKENRGTAKSMTYRIWCHGTKTDGTRTRPSFRYACLGDDSEAIFDETPDTDEAADQGLAQVIRYQTGMISALGRELSTSHDKIIKMAEAHTAQAQPMASVLSTAVGMMGAAMQMNWSALSSLGTQREKEAEIEAGERKFKETLRFLRKPAAVLTRMVGPRFLSFFGGMLDDEDDEDDERSKPAKKTAPARKAGGSSAGGSSADWNFADIAGKEPSGPSVPEGTAEQPVAKEPEPPAATLVGGVRELKETISVAQWGAISRALGQKHFPLLSNVFDAPDDATLLSAWEAAQEVLPKLLVIAKTLSKEQTEVLMAMRGELDECLRAVRSRRGSAA